jgi:hypothetical protein
MKSRARGTRVTAELGRLRAGRREDGRLRGDRALSYLDGEAVLEQSAADADQAGVTA